MKTPDSPVITEVVFDEDSLEDLYRNFGKEALARFFKKQSIISRMLMEDPGTFKMLEIVYANEILSGSIDNYLLSSLPAQALRNRMAAVISYLDQVVRDIIAKKQGTPVRIANLGSGSSRDIISVMAKNSGVFKFVFTDCIDTDPDALAVAQKLAEEAGIRSNFNFVLGNLSSLIYNRELNVGILVGVLCGLEHRKCVIILKKIRRYFKKGGILIASNVTKKMIEEEPFFSRIVLGEIMGWKLVFKTTEELRQIFEEAGYEWVDVFYDEPTRFHAMGVGRVPFI